MKMHFTRISNSATPQMFNVMYVEFINVTFFCHKIKTNLI